jgi:hypothetical protein
MSGKPLIQGSSGCRVKVVWGHGGNDDAPHAGGRHHPVQILGSLVKGDAGSVIIRSGDHDQNIGRQRFCIGQHVRCSSADLRPATREGEVLAQVGRPRQGTEPSAREVRAACFADRVAENCNANRRRCSRGFGLSGLSFSAIRAFMYLRRRGRRLWSTTADQANGRGYDGNGRQAKAQRSPQTADLIAPPNNMRSATPGCGPNFARLRWTGSLVVG